MQLNNLQIGHFSVIHDETELEKITNSIPIMDYLLIYIILPKKAILKANNWVYM